MWFNCNNLPTFGGDKGKWVYERMLPILCNNVIPKEKRDAALLDKMMKEKNTIVKRSLEALDRLIENDFYIEPTEEMKKTLRRYEISNNTLLMFIDEYCVNTSDLSTKTKRSVFNKCYDNWCKRNNNGRGKLGSNAVKSLLAEKYNETFKKSNGIWYLDKIGITPEAQEDLGVYNSGNDYLS